jgi:AbrB family looped-hinge helix DNA binding protein
LFLKNYLVNFVLTAIFYFVSQKEFSMSFAKVGRRGQITLPRDVRLTLKIQEGDRIAFVQRGDEIVLQPLVQTLFSLRGSVPVSGPQDFAAIREKVHKIHAQKRSHTES